MLLEDAYLYLSSLKKRAALRKALATTNVVEYLQAQHGDVAEDLQKAKTAMAKVGAKFWACEEIDFPQSLRGLTDWPLGLYYKGDRGLLEGKKVVAIVGTRRATAYGKAVAKALSSELVRHDIVVVSGLAMGIDAAAHEGALEANGTTVGVLGCGIDKIYPRENRELFAEVEREGVLLSEFAAGVSPTPSTFPQRNRIVAGLADAVVVVESEASGGAMITAGLANKFSKPLFGVPGRIDSPFSEGAHQLIAKGATIVASVEGFVGQLAQVWAGSQTQLFDGGNLEESSTKSRKQAKKSADRRLAGFEKLEALLPEEYANFLQIDFSHASAQLMELELEGKVVKRLDGRYEMVALL